MKKSNRIVLPVLRVVAALVVAFVLIPWRSLFAPKPNSASDFTYEVNQEGTGILISKYIGTAIFLRFPLLNKSSFGRVEKRLPGTP